MQYFSSTGKTSWEKANGRGFYFNAQLRRYGGDLQGVLDAVKAIMAGASVTMLASELIAHGSGRVSELLADLEDWLETYEYQSVSQMKGSMSQKSVADPAAFERANYMKALSSYDNRLP